MVVWRMLGIFAAALLGTGPLWAQPWELKERVQSGDCFAVQLTMKLSGEWHIQQEGQTQPVRLSAHAAHEFCERTLVVGGAGLPQKVLRYYHTAQASITAGSHVTQRTVRPERRLQVAQRVREQLCCYSPEGSMTREELQTFEHLDTLALTGLLPHQAVTVGQTWKPASSVVQALCAFEGLIEHDWTCKLESATDDQARLTVSGTAAGIHCGALVKLTVQATGIYDRQQRRLTQLEWQQKDVRDQGPVSPAMTVTATWTVRRTHLEDEPREVSDVVLVKVPEGDEPPAASLQLFHQDTRQGYRLTYDRDWHIVGQKDRYLILRLMDRGDWVAQATITIWDKAEEGKHLNPDEFKETLADIPGWDADEIREDGEVRSEKGHWIYRVSALGEMDGLKVLQNFYLVAGPQGDQVVVAVTLKPSLAEKLGTRDFQLVNGLDWPQ